MIGSVTTYNFKDIEPEDYKRDKLTPHQIAKQRTVMYGTPDPDVIETVTDASGTKSYINEVQPDGSTLRKLAPKSRSKTDE